MKAAHTFLGTTFLLLVWPSISSAQAEKSASPATEPPKILLLVHQEFRFGKAVERQKLEAAISRACEHLNVPNDWIDLESISGPPEALFFDPFDSFEHVDTALDRKSTRLNSSHTSISYAVFCLKKKKTYYSMHIA